MNLTFFDYFKSFYYVNTYLPPVDVSEQSLSQHLMEHENPEVAQIAQRLFSDPEVQKAFSSPITFDRTTRDQKAKLLESHGFKILNPSRTVVEHNDLPGWVIKSGANPLPKDIFTRGPMNDKKETVFHTPDGNLLRIEMAERIATIAKEENLDLVIPKKRLVAYPNTQGITDLTRKYFLLSEKLDILSAQETGDFVAHLSEEDQRELAKKISHLIQKTGWVDPAPRNLRFTRDGKLAIIDTEPFSLMRTKKSLFSSSVLIPVASVEKCARVGLFTLLEAISKMEPHTKTLGESILPKIAEFHKQLKSEYEKISIPQLSYGKIAHSILSLGLLPLAHAFITFSTVRFIEKTHAETERAVKSYKEKCRAYYEECDRKLESMDFTKEHQKQLFSKLNPLFRSLEGVPF